MIKIFDRPSGTHVIVDSDNVSVAVLAYGAWYAIHDDGSLEPLGAAAAHLYDIPPVPWPSFDTLTPETRELIRILGAGSGAPAKRKGKRTRRSPSR